MLDKSIPYFNIVMRRKDGTPIPQPVLPDGYSFVQFSDGDEKNWAEIEASVGEFENTAEALAYFQSEFLPYVKELERRSLFIQNKNGKKVATITNWWNYTGERRDPSLNWVGVMPEYQGLGLGKALVFEGMQRMLCIEGDRDIFLHTQTWSYKAIGIYLLAGFEFMESGSFGGYENDYEKAMSVLREKMKDCYKNKTY